MKRGLFVAAALAGSLACAQTFQWPENYAPTAAQGGTINEVVFSDFLTLNPVLSSSATETAILGMVGGLILFTATGWATAHFVKRTVHSTCFLQKRLKKSDQNKSSSSHCAKVGTGRTV